MGDDQSKPKGQRLGGGRVGPRPPSGGAGMSAEQMAAERERRALVHEARAKKQQGGRGGGGGGASGKRRAAEQWEKYEALSQPSPAQRYVASQRKPVGGSGVVGSAPSPSSSSQSSSSSSSSRSASGGAVKCPVCARRFASEEAVARHFSMDHDGAVDDTRAERASALESRLAKKNAGAKTSKKRKEKRGEHWERYQALGPGDAAPVARVGTEQLANEDLEVVVSLRSGMRRVNELFLGSRESLQATLKMIRTMCSKILAHPDEAKFRKVKLSNSKVQAKIVKVEGVLDMLGVIGFEQQGDELLVLPESADLRRLQLALDTLPEAV